MSSLGEHDPFAWVGKIEIPDFAKTIRELRENERKPALAIQALEEFALRRSTDELLELRTGNAQDFHPLDATVVLTRAALALPVGQAAALAIRQWEMESAPEPGRSPLTDSIVHDVTAQRTIPEVADFIVECRLQGAGDLVSKILGAFTGTTATSGRTALDKALLYITLRGRALARGAGERLGRETAGLLGRDAAELLRDMLREASRGGSELTVPGTGERVGVAGALHQLSPSETIAEDWLRDEMKHASRQQATAELAAGLLRREPEGSAHLAAHIGRTWEPRWLITLCEILAPPAPGSARELDRIRQCIASRNDHALADIVEFWFQSGKLAGTLEKLLDDIVAAAGDGSPGPRKIGTLDDLHGILRNDECRRKLRVAVAKHVEGRTGAEIASLLGKVGRKDLGRAAAEVNRGLLAGTSVGADFADYLDGLQELPEAAGLTSLALRELSAPTASGTESGRLPSVVADIATGLYRRGHARIAYDLLERCLANDQWLTPDGAVEIVGRVRSGLVPGDNRWDLLLSATVGRWPDTNRRDEVVEELLARGRDDDVVAIIQPLQ